MGHRHAFTGTQRCAPERLALDQEGNLFLESHPSCVLCLQFDKPSLGPPPKWSGMPAGGFDKGKLCP